MYIFDCINANIAFVSVLKEIKDTTNFISHGGMMYYELSPCLIKIECPRDREIKWRPRKWQQEKAEAEWQWYLKGTNLVSEIEKDLPRWRDFSDDGKTVNSAYGYLWSTQLPAMINKIIKDKQTRHAVISLYDGNRFANYEGKDTVCTLTIQFMFRDDKLNMFVNMRSNDLVWGFCNDQYSFSKLQEMVAKRLNVEVGTYYHYTASMHLYERHFKLLEEL